MAYLAAEVYLLLIFLKLSSNGTCTDAHNNPTRLNYGAPSVLYCSNAVVQLMRSPALNFYELIQHLNCVPNLAEGHAFDVPRKYVYMFKTLFFIFSLPITAFL